MNVSDLEPDVLLRKRSRGGVDDVFETLEKEKKKNKVSKNIFAMRIWSWCILHLNSG